MKSTGIVLLGPTINRIPSLKNILQSVDIIVTFATLYAMNVNIQPLF